MLLDHFIPWPEIPEHPPESASSRLSKRRDFWQRQALILWLVAQGFSLETELRFLMAKHLSIAKDSGSIKRAIKSLCDANVLYRTILKMRSTMSVKMAVVKITAPGQELCQTLGWEVTETEWERMKRLHEKGRQESAHTCAVLAFTYQARRRGWKAGVMPEVDAGRFVPDAVIQDPDDASKREYIEVEMWTRKRAKWQNMYADQGMVHLCARTPEHRETLIQECQEAGVDRGKATDLYTLFMEKKGLWAEEWL
ncbi:MAG: hypothetical protein U9O54_06945 [Chloroflexota bacterium]|nr:hypothetical protein [Chloroflexota bacterium]